MKSIPVGTHGLTLVCFTWQRRGITLCSRALWWMYALTRTMFWRSCLKRLAIDRAGIEKVGKF